MGLSSKHVDEDVLNGPQMERLEIPKVSNMPKAPPLKCPRCSSTSTKFCYYNNYSLTQPRHFCRTCRRHWTAGGSLRNIPSSECCKNKRRKTTATVITTSAAASDFPGITSPAVVENSVCSANLLTKSSRPLEFEFGTLSSGFSFYANSTSRFPFNGYSFEELKEGLIMDESKATASGSAEESLVFPASFLDFWDGGADFTARGFLGI